MRPQTQDDDIKQYQDLLDRLKRIETSLARLPATFTVAAKPTAAVYGIGFAFISDEIDGQRFQASDGANWKILG